MARILIAHKEKYLRNTLALIMESWGHCTEQAEDGWSALARILKSRNSSTPFDLLVVDVDMQDLHVRQLVKELVHRGVSVPIIVISGLFAGDAFEEIQTQIPVEVLQIPFADAQIRESLSRLLRAT